MNIFFQTIGEMEGILWDPDSNFVNACNWGELNSISGAHWWFVVVYITTLFGEFLKKRQTTISTPLLIVDFEPIYSKMMVFKSPKRKIVQNKCCLTWVRNRVTGFHFHISLHFVTIFYFDYKLCILLLFGWYNAYNNKFHELRCLTLRKYL